MIAARPKVSVCIPAYNHEKYVAECIESVLNQSFQDFEIVITDDASTDSTVDIIRTYRDPRIRLFQHSRNLGPSVAANNNMREARGEYLAFLPSDDAFLPTKLERQVGFLDQNPSCALLFGLVNVIDEEGAPFLDEGHFYFRVFDQPNRTRAQWLRHFFLYGNCLCGATAMARRSLCDDIGYHDPRLLQVQDLDYWIRVCFRFGIHVVQEPLTRYRIRAGELNASGARPDAQTRAAWEFRRILEHYLSIDQRDLFFEVFPEAAQIEETEEAPLHYLLARLALTSQYRPTQIFALDVLFDLLGRPESREALQRLGFGYAELLRMSGEKDLYSLHELGQRDATISRLSLSISECDARIARLDQAVVDGGERIASLTIALAERDGVVSRLTQRVDERDERIADFTQTMVERDETIDSLTQAIADRDQTLSSLSQGAAERDERIGKLTKTVLERDGAIASLTQTVAERDGLVGSIHASRSWRVTAPLRFVGHQARRIRLVFLAAPSLLHAGGSISATLRKAWRVLRRDGWPGVKRRILFVAGHSCVVRSDSHAILSTKDNDVLSQVGRSQIRARLTTLGYRPLVSVVMPVYNTPPKLLIEAVESVRSQLYQSWELCVCDDGSTNAEPLAALSSAAKFDGRIKIVSMERNAGISAATNMAVRHATGEFIALLDHDDLLTPDALAEVVLALNSEPDVDVVYSDQDKIDDDGDTFEPFFKPDWSPDYFRRVMYIGHLLLFRRSLFDRIGGFDSNFDKVQDYEFMLRLSEVTRKIHHIPKILYHWRATRGSVAQDPDGKSGIERLQLRAVASHLARCCISARVKTHPRFRHRVLIEPPARQEWPLVSIVIPTKDAPQHIGRCLESIFARSSYPNLEVIVVDNATTNKTAKGILDSYPLKIVLFDQPFNYSRANNLGVAEACGEFLILLNNDTQVITSNWVEEMLFHMQQKDVAAVGPSLLFPDNTVQHAGVVLGPRGTADHVMRRFPGDSDGYAGSLSCAREVSAVTAACLMCRRVDYLESGGMSEFFSTHYQDLDLCFRLASGGRRILFIPQAVLYHFESATRGSYYDRLDRLLLLDLWGETIVKGDRYYNPNFSLERLDYSVKSNENVCA